MKKVSVSTWDYSDKCKIIRDIYKKIGRTEKAGENLDALCDVLTEMRPDVYIKFNFVKRFKKKNPALAESLGSVLNSANIASNL